VWKRCFLTANDSAVTQETAGSRRRSTPSRADDFRGRDRRPYGAAAAVGAAEVDRGRRQLRVKFLSAAELSIGSPPARQSPLKSGDGVRDLPIRLQGFGDYSRRNKKRATAGVFSASCWRPDAVFFRPIAGQSGAQMAHSSSVAFEAILLVTYCQPSQHPDSNRGPTD